MRQPGFARPVAEPRFAEPRFAEGWLEPQKLAEKVPPGTTPTQVAAWTAVSRVLLNLDETITKE